MNARSVILFLCLVGSTAPPARAVTRPPVSYGRDIRPTLSDKCYHCHGPDAETRKADLRLDTREGLSGDIVAAGKPGQSELITRIFSADDDVRMPPPESKISLTPEQRDLLRQWVMEGAKFIEHWAFQPLPAKINVPVVTDESWPRDDELQV